MDIIKCKYKAHKFVNSMFYFIIFAIGFVLGLLFNGISKISAIEIRDDFTKDIITYNISDSTIYNLFYELHPNITDEDLNYVICKYPYADNNKLIECFAWKDISNLYIDYLDYGTKNFTIYYAKYFYEFRLNYLSSKPLAIRFRPDFSYKIKFNDTSYEKYISHTYNLNSHVSYDSWTNFDIQILLDNTIRLNKTISGKTYEQAQTIINNIKTVISINNNTLDFSSSTIKFNENLFNDDSNFKKICIEPYKSFAITRNDGLYLSNDTDFLWFPYHLGDQFAKNSYNLSSSGKFVVYTPDLAYLHYNFNSKFAIDTLYSFPPTSTLFPNKGYTQKYKYYGWYAYPFSMTFTEDDSEMIFDIFSISSAPSKIHISESGTEHGGGGHKLDEDDNVIEDNITENGLYCFYIKNEYSFTYVNTDSYGDFFGAVETPNGNYNFDTTYHKDNFNSSNSFSTVSSFISSIYGSLSVVRDFITSIFNEFPLVLKSFIISIFIILLVYLIIKMVVK